MGVPAYIVDIAFVAFVGELNQHIFYQKFVSASQIFGNLEADSHQIPYFDFFIRRSACENAGVDSRPLNRQNFLIVTLESMQLS